MRLRLRLPDREDIADIFWKVKFKLRSTFTRTDRTIADFSSESSFDLGSHSAAGDHDRTPHHHGRPPPEKDGTSEEGKDAGFGATPAVKTLYERRNSSDSWVDWVDYPPKQLSKSAAKAQDRVAIKLYKVRDTDKPAVGGRFSLKSFRIDVQNLQLVSVLAEILKKENEHIEPNDTATFREPFRSLFFCYNDIVARYKTLPGTAENDPLRTHMLLLIKVLDDLFGEMRAKRRSLLASGLVSFKLSWTLFPRDCEIVSWGNNTELILKVVDAAIRQVNPLQGVLVIRCKVLRFNGEAFVWEDVELDIPQFEGNKPITDLPHYPLRFLPDAGETKARLAERGRKVLDYQGLTYCMYSGIGIYHEDKRVEKHNVDGRILIDVVGFNKHHLAQGIREGRAPETKRNMVRGTGRPPPPRDRKVPEKAVIAKRLDEQEQQKNKEAMLANEEDLVFMSPLIDGYALKNKLWLSFYVEDIKPMVWNDQAFDHLVYDEEQKDLVLAFVENHNNTSPMPGDVIKGKGEGLIVLLSGPPGTGKTLTAEAVADRTHRPLVYLQAEDLGINALMLGMNIKRIFQMATEWNAVILLDEADVFMAERHPHDIARNELVSIFLRELEYYRGIIFLTTNLYQTIDSAFRSRVSLHLLFKPLSLQAREAVWRKFLDRLPGPGLGRGEAEGSVVTEVTVNETEEAPGGVQVQPTDESSPGPVEAEAGDSSTQPETETVEGVTREVQARPVIDISDDDIKELAAWHLNGREIKNAVKMVKSWCDCKGYDLTLARLENGIRATSPHASKVTHENDTSLYDD
ncbi:putative aaa family protein [Echria macrotheca]|uniref:Aaa family protein n=1 Tax=Echria macrotheca TaxID=438768 RepID=A0AAJ0FG57_9PEZI|nr:putative aaa family protein [Echria macrotheca]